MPQWRDISFEEICAHIHAGHHHHVAILLGSAISYGYPSSCLSVHQFQVDLTLEPMRDITSSDEVQRIATSLIAALKTGPPDAPTQLAQLPFEQFMGCLHMVDAEAGFGVVELGCGLGFERRPNANHESVAELVAWLLQTGHADRVTVLTTNYDPWLDDALNVALGAAPTPVDGLSIPRSEVRIGNGLLRYAKLHGTLSARETLVFTFEQMARLVVDANELTAVQTWLLDDGSVPSLILVAGYGFWDPDLRPLLRRLVGPRSVVIRNERPRGDVGSIEGKSARAPTGPEALQGEFFDDLAKQVELREYRSWLMGNTGGPDGPSLLTGLRKAVVRADAKDAPPPDQQGLAELRHRSKDLLAKRLAGREAVFLGRLLDSACIPEGTNLFRLCAATSRGQDQRDLVRAHLYSRSNAHRMDEAAMDCRSIRRELPDAAVVATTLAFESFALTIGQTRSALGAARCLRRCRALLDKCDADTAAFVEHYDSHFRVKALEAALLTSGDWGYVAGLHRFAAYKATRMADRLQEAITDAREARDLRLMSDASTLRVECLILARRLKEAEAEAVTARDIRLFMGRFNNAALVDRMMGWIELAKGDAAARARAVGHFVRGLWRAIACNDISIRGKVAANLVRAAYGRHVAELDFNRRVGAEPPSLLETCGILAEEIDAVLDVGRSDEAKTLDQRRLVGVVVDYLIYLYGERGNDLKAEMLRFSNLKRYPIYLPLEPPPNQG